MIASGPDAAPDWRTGVPELVERALAEDLGAGDVTAEAVVPAEATARARIVRKQAGVVFGLEIAAEVFRQTGAGELAAMAPEGEWRDAVPELVAGIEGPARALLAAERTALNLLGHLSGVATKTATFVRTADAAGERARAAGDRLAARTRILDTRKTLPGLRALEKAAVAAGGGVNHRMGLYDAILIKENHAAMAGGVGAAVARARAAKPGLAIEIECRDQAEVEQALAERAERILLDNMDLEGLRAAIAAREHYAAEHGFRAELEASGGVDLETVGPIAATGVDFVSVGALTHSAPVLDLSLLLDPL